MRRLFFLLGVLVFAVGLAFPGAAEGAATLAEHTGLLDRDDPLFQTKALAVGEIAATATSLAAGLSPQDKDFHIAQQATTTTIEHNFSRHDPKLQGQGEQLEAFFYEGPEEEDETVPEAPGSPERDRRASFEQVKGQIFHALEKSYEAQARLESGDIRLETLAKSVGAYGVDGLVVVTQALDTATLGAYSTVTDLLDQGAQMVRTGVRRGTREVSGHQTLGQEVGDYTYVVLSVAGPKGIGALKNIKSLKTAHLLTTSKGRIVKRTALKPGTKAEASLPMPRRENQLPYVPHAMREMLKANNPGREITSSTLPKKGAKGVKHAGKRHPETGVVYDRRGLPDFTPHMLYETQLSKTDFFPKKGNEKALSQGRTKHMRQATRQLRKDIKVGKVSRDQFDSHQIQAIESGKAQIPKLTWEHNPRAGRMQLVRRKEHGETPHIGSIALFKKGKKEK